MAEPSPHAEPPYPDPQQYEVLVKPLTEKLLKDFEEGRLSVAGAIRAAIVTAWAVGHGSGEDVCLGCAHRAVTNPMRTKPHNRCFDLSTKYILHGMDVFVAGLRYGIQESSIPTEKLFEVTDTLRALINGYPKLAEALNNRSKEQTDAGGREEGHPA